MNEANRVYEKDIGKLIGLIEKAAILKHATVAMGVRNPDSETIKRVIKAVERNYADVILVGDRKEIEEAASGFKKERECLPFQIVDTKTPEEELISLLVSGKADAAIRGTANASESLSNLKKACHIDKIHRISILLTTDGNPYFSRRSALMKEQHWKIRLNLFVSARIC